MTDISLITWEDLQTYADQGALNEAVEAYSQAYAKWLQANGDTFEEMAIKLRDFADFLDAASARWWELEGTDTTSVKFTGDV